MKIKITDGDEDKSWTVTAVEGDDMDSLGEFISAVADDAGWDNVEVERIVD